MPMTDILTADTSILNQTSSEADHRVAEVWEAWYLGLRAHLHWCVNEEHGGASALENFFDAYGLAIETAAGNPCLVEFLQAMPPEPGKYNPALPAPDLLNRVFAAAEMKPVEFPNDDLPQVASALREKAAAFVRLAEKIEAGDFAFPRP